MLKPFAQQIMLSGACSILNGADSDSNNRGVSVCVIHLPCIHFLSPRYVHGQPLTYFPLANTHSHITDSQAWLFDVHTLPAGQVQRGL